MQATRDKAMKPSIVITELPYQTNKSDFVATVARLVEEQKLTGACDIVLHQCTRHLELKESVHLASMIVQKVPDSERTAADLLASSACCLVPSVVVPVILT